MLIEYVKQQFEEIEELNRASEARKFYAAVAKMRKVFQPRERCMDKQGTVLNEDKDILNIWAEHLEELLNKNLGLGGERLENTMILTGPDRGNVESPTKLEVSEVIKKLKCNKAPGEDEIVAEMIKYGGRSLEAVIHKLIVRIWEEETMPECWKMSLICPIFKKGDKMACENYRGIALLNVAYKVLSGVVNERLKKYSREYLR
jgi:hypothetical protein